MGSLVFILPNSSKDIPFLGVSQLDLQPHLFFPESFAEFVEIGYTVALKLFVCGTLSSNQSLCGSPMYKTMKREAFAACSAVQSPAYSLPSLCTHLGALGERPEVMQSMWQYNKCHCIDQACQTYSQRGMRTSGHEFDMLRGDLPAPSAFSPFYIFISLHFH